jgi:hypothetical protein
MIGMPKSMMQEAAQPMGPPIRKSEVVRECPIAKFEVVDHSPAPSTPVHLTNLWFGDGLVYGFSIPRIQVKGVLGQASDWVGVDAAGDELVNYRPDNPKIAEPKPSATPSWLTADPAMHERNPDGFLTTRALLVRYDAEKEAAKPKPDAEGWINWGGGGGPIPSNSVVDVMLRDGTFHEHLRASRLRWIDLGTSGDIVAYRVVG